MTELTRTPPSDRVSADFLGGALPMISGRGCESGRGTSRRNRILAFFMACLALSWVAQAAETDTSASGGASENSISADMTGWVAPDFVAMDKPNDNGSAVLLTWKKMPYESPEVLYEILMDEDRAELFTRLDGLVELKVIDSARKDEILREFGIKDRDSRVFTSQFALAAQKPKEGSALAPPCPTRTSDPASYGFARDNEDYHSVEVSRIVGRKDIVLYISSRWNAALVEAIRRGGLVSRIVNVEDPDRCEIKVETVSEGLQRGRTYFFRIDVRRGNTRIAGARAAHAAPLDNLFAWHKTNLLIAVVVLGVLIMAFAKIAKRDPTKLFIRRIAGLEAVEEALGRAAEMGKPVYFCHGPGDLSSVVTISAINLLGKIAERVGEYGTELKVTCLDYLVMQVSQEMVRDAFTRVGRSDAYRDDNVVFVTGDTFAYSAAVGGMMIREKVGTAFFFGRFGSESLLLSETGAITKAIQIAGTDSFTQIPFFITTCDYTLIGEEMYAGSAYLSREPRLVGAVKGQDAVKTITMTLIVVGTVLASMGFMRFAQIFWPLT
jgi:hypothetical protein